MLQLAAWFSFKARWIASWIFTSSIVLFATEFIRRFLLSRAQKKNQKKLSDDILRHQDRLFAVEADWIESAKEIDKLK